MRMIFEREQEEILETIEKAVGELGTPWNKYKGDVCCRVIQKYARKYIPKDQKIVGPNVYADGLPSEYDLFLLDKAIRPKKYTNAYPLESVHCAIEIKKRGIYGGRKNLGAAIKKIRENFNLLIKENPKVKCAYLTVQEVWKPRKKGSIDYLKETREKLRPFKVFALKESRSRKPLEGQWKRFIDYLRF